jgi:uncharacterized protein with HEPN domain
VTRADKDPAYLDDIREACATIMAYVREKTLVDFIASRLLQDGVIRRLGIIGEAAKSLSVKAKDRYPSVAWRDMARLRDLVVHHDWKIGLPEIWGIATNDIPALLKTLS